jgi:hypothetical protein
MEKEKRDKSIGILLFLIILAMIILGNIVFAGSDASESIIPFTGLPWVQHVLIYYILYPIVGSFITVIFLPLVLLPIFMLLKKRILYRFEDCFVDMGDLKFDLKIFLKRGIYIALLILGIIISFGFLINPAVFLSDYSLDTTYYSGNLLFDPYVLNMLFNLLSPLSMGLWAVGWVMEDIGLMHYKFPSENERTLFEIEPVHLKYNGFLKGYAGIASVIFVINAFMVYLEVWALHILQVGIYLMIIFYLFPVYLIYLKMVPILFQKLFRKGLDEIEVPSKASIQKKE